MNLSKIKHIAAIMDGNGRYAKNHNLSPLEGYTKGLETAENFVKFCQKQEIPFITLYVFSYENWQRDEQTVQLLMELLETYIKKNLEEPFAPNAKIKFIGDSSLMSENLQNLMAELEGKTKHNKYQINLAISYGSRNEITRAVNSIINNIEKGTEITEEKIVAYLDTSDSPDPDLIIRTGGNYRLSNFLLWQAAYSELLFFEKLWPELQENDFISAITEYNNRTRTYGK